jgi:dinuclear metal center YbgI/SA1388 family protein
MMVTNTTLEKDLHYLLKCDDFKDHCPNGMQVEGKNVIKKIVTAVSASVALFEKAIAAGADAIIVHHGIIWNYANPVYRGGYKKRVRLLLENDINLFGYHLPLDAHPLYGNNMGIANALGLKNIDPFGGYNGQLIGVKGQLDSENVDELSKKIRSRINKNAIIFNDGPAKVKNVGIISGGAYKNINDAVREGLDFYITGEATEFILHYVKEEKIHFAAAGHYATEVFGVQALGKYIKETYSVEVEFIDIPNPV